MKLEEKLMEERRKLGLSQEQLADRLGVTRQSVSKWESGSSIPELTKLIQLSEMFGVSMDYLVKQHMDTDYYSGVHNNSNGGSRDMDASLEDNTRLENKVDDLAKYIKGNAYTFTSKTKVLGIPLVSIHFTSITKKGKAAKGIIAIGNKAVGVISIGGVSCGLISIGGVSFGVLSLGCVAIGLAAFGFTAIGILAMGFVAAGIYAGGFVASGIKLGVGFVAAGRTVVGYEIKGEYMLKWYEGITKDVIREFLLTHCPGLWKTLADVFAVIGESVKGR